MTKIIVSTISLVSVLIAAVDSESCFVCHGEDWSKKALGKSKVVANMTHDEIAISLIGYKNGTYGRIMKGLMKDKIKDYSIQELKEFAQTIGKK